MREIKFRAWDKVHCLMYDWETVKSEFVMRDFESDDLVMLQYTGLEDKNGLEIYEGDIVKWGHTGEYFRETPHRIAVVQFDPDIQYHIVNFRYRGRKVVFEHGNFNYANEIDKALEVIGNIYQNPELLGAEQ